MIFFTQLIYIKEGKEDVFDRFEAIAIPLISKYNGRLLLRIRPDKDAYLEAKVEKPYEIHFGEFDSADDFDNFLKDEERRKIMHLKEESIESSIVVRGTRL